MNKLNKGQRLKNGTVLRSDYYQKRRKVLDILYRAKKLVPDAPRVEIKIMTDSGGLGWAGDDFIIAIGDKVPDSQLVHVVLHELVHTWFNVKSHDKMCDLMKPFYDKTCTDDKAWKAFRKYIKQ